MDLSHGFTIHKLIFKFTQATRKPRVTSTKLKLNKVRGCILPTFRTYLKLQSSRKICTVYRLDKIHQWDRMKSPEIDPLVFDKGAKAMV